MKSIREIMGMPIAVEIIDSSATQEDLSVVYEFFEYVDEKFSTYKPESEISLINLGKIGRKNFSADMKEIFRLSQETKTLSKGFFDILTPEGKYDPSGLVKGWAIKKAADILLKRGLENFYIEAGGDVQAYGKNREGKNWSVGIKNPFDQRQIVKVVYLANMGIATSGSYIRGQHIYNPHQPNLEIEEIVSLSVIGPNVYQADRFATAGFAMGRQGIDFVENLEGFEGYMIDKKAIATMTSGFEKYVNTTK